MKIFLGAPFVNWIDPKTDQLEEKHKKFIKKLIAFFESKGHEITNAHQREAWGKKFLGNKKATKLDLDEVKNCDLFIAIPGTPASGGVHIEIGWGAAQKKKILLLLNLKKNYSPLIHGLIENEKNIKAIKYAAEKGLFRKLEKMFK